MASSGPLNPGTLADDTSYGGTIAWTDPTNAGASDDSRASAVVTAFASTYILKATNFGFAIPTGATIDGIVAHVERRYEPPTAGRVQHATVRLYKAGVLAGDDKSDSADWLGTDNTYTFGGAADLWNTTWTVAQINASDFGVGVSANEVSGLASITAQIDWLGITVYYTPLDSAETVFSRACISVP